MEEGAPPAEGGAPAPGETAEDKKIVHTYPLVKTCDMPEEMWSEVMELVVTGCEKFAYNYELASKLIKQGLDQRFGPPWNIVVGEAYGYEVTYLVGSLMLMYTGGNIACIWDMNSEFQTLLITATALLCHVQRIYPIGAGGDAWLDYYQPNFTSVCFVLGVSLLLSSKELWPTALRRPSQPILFCYLALVSAFTVSVTLRTVWLPLTLSIAKSNFWLARKIKTTKALKKLWLLKMSRVLESQTLQNLEVTLVAVIFLHYSLKASGVYNELLQTAYPSTKSPKPCIGKAKSDFTSRMSDSFIPFAVRKKH